MNLEISSMEGLQFLRRLEDIPSKVAGQNEKQVNSVGAEIKDLKSVAGLGPRRRPHTGMMPGLMKIRDRKTRGHKPLGRRIRTCWKEQGRLFPWKEQEKDCYVSIPKMGEKCHQDQPPATFLKGSWLSDFCAFTLIVPSSLKSLISCHISSGLKQCRFSNCLLRPISNITSNVELSLILSGKICDLCHRSGVKQPQ